MGKQHLITPLGYAGEHNSKTLELQLAFPTARGFRGSSIYVVLGIGMTIPIFIVFTINHIRFRYYTYRFLLMLVLLFLYYYYYHYTFIINSRISVSRLWFGHARLRGVFRAKGLLGMRLRSSQ